MSEKSNSNLVRNRAVLLAKIQEIDRVVFEIAQNGAASASVSAGGGSKSYTRLDLDKLTALRSTYARRVTAINRRLANLPSLGIRHVMTVRC